MPSHRKRLLIADDYQPFTELCADLLCSEFDIVGIAHNGQDLLDQVKGRHPDLVLLDINMPGMNSFEVAAKLRDLYPAVKIILMTASDDLDTSALVAASGASAVVLKGYGADLKKLVRECLFPAVPAMRDSAVA